MILGKTFKTSGQVGDFIVLFDRANANVTIKSKKTTALLSSVQALASWSSTGAKKMSLTGTATIDGTVVSDDGQGFVDVSVINVILDGSDAGTGLLVSQARKLNPGVIMASPGATNAKLIARSVGDASCNRIISFSGAYDEILVDGQPAADIHITGDAEISYSITAKSGCTATDSVTATMTVIPPGPPFVTSTPQDSVKFVLSRVILITPGGDAVSSPNDAGDGQNQFTFDAATPGVLTVNFKAQYEGPAEIATVAGTTTFAIDDCGDSTMTWAAANPGGKASVSGTFLVATVTFTGLPTASTSFGKKNASVTYAAGTDTILTEMFFNKTATNHPAGELGSPNWYYYWRLSSANLASASMVYSGPGRSNFDYFAARTIKLHDDACGTQIAAWGTPKGIDTFAWTTGHENKHFIQITGFWPVA